MHWFEPKSTLQCMKVWFRKWQKSNYLDIIKMCWHIFFNGQGSSVLTSCSWINCPSEMIVLKNQAWKGKHIMQTITYCDHADTSCCSGEWDGNIMLPFRSKKAFWGRCTHNDVIRLFFNEPFWLLTFCCVNVMCC